MEAGKRRTEIAEAETDTLSRSRQERKARPSRDEATSGAHCNGPAAAGCQSPRPGHAPHLAGPALLASQRSYLSVGLWKVSPPKTSLDSLIVERRFRASEGTTKKKKKDRGGRVCAPKALDTRLAKIYLSGPGGTGLVNSPSRIETKAGELEISAVWTTE